MQSENLVSFSVVESEYNQVNKLTRYPPKLRTTQVKVASRPAQKIETINFCFKGQFPKEYFKYLYLPNGTVTFSMASVNSGWNSDINAASEKKKTDC